MFSTEPKVLEKDRVQGKGPQRNAENISHPSAQNLQPKGV
jgi:hypothetical protein